MARLARLLEHVDVFERPGGDVRLEVAGVTETLDDVGPGWLFACVRGVTRDGHDFAEAAVERGATVLLVDRELPARLTSRASVVRVYDVRAALGRVAAAFHEYPAQHLKLVGVTGTNGKTTTVHMLSSIFDEFGWKADTIGTLGGHYTTPPPVQLQSILAEHRRARFDAVAMEVSSAGLDQHRVDPIRFDVAVFTNLSRDHLDYHGTMERYFEAKSMLFDPLRARHGVVNTDDEYGRRLAERIEFPLTTFGLADAGDIERRAGGTTFSWRAERIELALLGDFNISNALGAAHAASVLDIPDDVIAAGLSNVAQVPGRFESIDCGQGFSVVVDFAHTPDGLDNVLRVARAVVRGRAPDGGSGRVIVVFGAGGDRDPGKRPKMGAIASALADLAIVTNDNPRGEDPSSIAEQIVGGVSMTVELDRAAAISRAVESAREGDIVVIAGKGHETTQEIAGTRHPFNDADVVRRVLAGVAP